MSLNNSYNLSKLIRKSSFIRYQRYFILTFLFLVILQSFDIYCSGKPYGDGKSKITNSSKTIPADLEKKLDSLIREALNKLQSLQNIEGQEEAFEKYDKIITFDDKVHIVKVKQITYKEIKFLYPLNTEISSISRSKVSQIIYGNGIIDLFFPFDEDHVDSLNLPVERMIIDEKKEWEKVKILYNSDQLNNIEYIGPITLIYESSRAKISNEDLENIAIMLLKKKVVQKEGNYAIIQNKSIERNYGLMPSIKIKASIYKEN